MYITKKLSLIFLITCFTFSCIKNSSETHFAAPSEEASVLYAFSISKDDKYVCVFKCNGPYTNLCITQYRTEKSKADLNDQVINLIKNPTKDANELRGSLFEVITSLANLTKKTLSSEEQNRDEICKMENHFEEGGRLIASLLTLDEKRINIHSNLFYKKTIDDTWKEYEYKTSSETKNVLYNTKDASFVTKTSDFEPKTFPEAETTCSKLSFVLFDQKTSGSHTNNPLVNYIREYDKNSEIFTNHKDCIWLNGRVCSDSMANFRKDDARPLACSCYSIKDDYTISARKTDEHQFLCHLPLSSWLTVERYMKLTTEGRMIP